MVEFSYQPNGPETQVALRMHRGYVFDLVGWWEPHMPKKAPAPPGTPQKDAFLWLLWPTLEPKTQANAAQFNVPGGGTMIHVLLRGWSDWPRDPLPTKTLDAYLNRLVLFEREQVVLYLGEPTPPLVDYAPRYGLSVQGAAPDFLRSMNKLGDAQILLPSDWSGTVAPSAVIRCTFEEVPDPEDAPGAYRTPQCKHWFVHRASGSIVSLGYRRVHLPEWQSIQSRVDALLSSFVVKP